MLSYVDDLLLAGASTEDRFSCLLERFCKNYNTFGVVGQMAFILPCIFVGLRTAFVMSWNTFFLQQRPRVLEQRLVCFGSRL